MFEQFSQKALMKQIAIIFCLLTGIAGNLFCQDLYDIETVNTIELFFVEENWDQILDSLRIAGDEERLIGTAVVNGIQFDSVGVRYKGNSSYSPNNAKNPLNIKLDHVIEDQTYNGYGTIKLGNGFKDPSFLRDVMSYEIARNYMSAGRANYANVYINSGLIGLYSSAQSVDKFFLQNHFMENDNAFFKGELTQGGPPSPTNVWGYLGEDSTSYFNYYELRSDDGWSELIYFLNIFNNNTAMVEDVLDVDRLLWMLAYDILMINLDAPINFGHNFYLYKDNSSRFVPIIWDLNENFGGFTMLLGGPPLSLIQMQQLTPLLNISNPNYPIINKILPNPVFQKIYIAHMKTIIEEYFENGYYLERALQIQSIIDADVQADPHKFYTYQAFLDNLYISVGFGPGTVVGISQLMEARIDYLANHPLFQWQPPEISNISTYPSIVHPNSTVWFNAEITNGNIAELGYRYNLTDRFEKTDMFDDGNHNDGLAGDGIFGVSIEAGSGDIQYYIYAMNNSAVSFSPPRAEFEYYTLNVAVNIVINEFMADNETTITDPQGQYDDWLEIHNLGEETVNLGGMFLTDDLSEPFKWEFPDTSLEGGGYLIVWIDDDEEDEGLHANFNLSAGGEAIGLANYAGEFIDQIVFGQQSPDTSYGRYPEGGEEWTFMPPTPGYANEPPLSVSGGEDESTPGVFGIESVYPNPFNPSTAISYKLQAASLVSLTVYDITGREVTTLVTGHSSLGEHRIVWDAEDLPSGVYFVRLKILPGAGTRQHGVFESVKKVVLMR